MRIINRPLAFLLAVALGAACVITVVEVIAVAVNSGPVLVPWDTWYRWAGRTHWNRPVVKVWSIVLAVAGALLLALELRRGKPRRISMQSTNDATDAAMTRRGFADTVRAAVLDVDGVSKATVTATRRSVAVTATAAARDRSAAEALVPPVTDVAQERLTSLQLQRNPRVRVRVRTKRK